MNAPFTFLFFSGDFATASFIIIITVVAAIACILLLVASIILRRVRGVGDDARDLLLATSKLCVEGTRLLGACWVLVTAVLLLAGTMTAAIDGAQRTDTTASHDRALVNIPGSDTLISTQGQGMFVAVDEGGTVTLKHVDGVQYEHRAGAVLRESTACKPYKALLAWDSSRFTCTHSVTAVLPR